MSESRTTHKVIDTWVRQSRPSDNNVTAITLGLDATSGDQSRAFLWLPIPIPAGARVLNATLRVYAHDSWGGSATLTVRRLASHIPFHRVTWNNQPGVTGASATLAKSTSRGDEWAIDVSALVQEVVSGAPWYGFRITTSRNGLNRIFSEEGVNDDWLPKMDLEWSLAPAAPTDLSPAGGRAVSVSHPTLQFSHNDPVGLSGLEAVQVQVDAAGTFGSPDWDSGQVPSTREEFPLAGSGYPGLSAGGSTQWRVRTWNDSGPSPWSDAATFSRVGKPTLTVSNPSAANPYVTEFTPPIIWSLSGATQTAWRVIVFEQGTDDRLYNSGWTDGADTSWTLPKGVLRRHGDYTLRVDVRDTVDREATPGDPARMSVTRDFDVRDMGSVQVPTGLEVTQPDHTPRVRLTWSAATAPDSWTVTRDGLVIAVGETPADLMVTTGVYAWEDWEASPRVPHVYQVRAVVNGQQGNPLTSDPITTSVSGLWLVDPIDGQRVYVSGENPVSWGMGETSTVLSPYGAREPILISQSLRGWEGTVDGLLVTRWGTEAGEWRDRLLSLRARQDRELVMAVSDRSIRVRIHNVVAGNTTDGAASVRSASFSFFQVGVRNVAGL